METETLHKQPETEKSSVETEHSQEQSPEQFRTSLEIFNSYKQVSPEEATQPEFTMRFDQQEQELVVGLRGALDEFIAEATENGDSVSIAIMFDRLDAAIRMQNQNADESTLDQLYLVATKMRYNLQVRYDRKQRSEDESATNPSAKRPSFSFAGAARTASGFDMNGGSSSQTFSKVRAQAYRQAMRFLADSDGVTDFSNPNDSSRPTTPTSDTTPHQAIPPSLEVQAHEQVMKYTGGRTFDSLDAKEQGRVTRQMARDFHPDIHPEKEAIYKEMTAQTAQKRNQPSENADSQPQNTDNA